MMCGSRDIEPERQKFLSFWIVLLSPMDPENQNTEKIKKAPGDIIILQICTVNDNHINVCFLRHGSRRT